MSKRVAIKSKDRVQAVTKAIVSGSMGTLDRIPSSVLGVVFDFIPSLALSISSNSYLDRMPIVHTMSRGGIPFLFRLNSLLLVCRGFYVSTMKHMAATKTLYSEACWFNDLSSPPKLGLSRFNIALVKSMYPKLQAVVVPLPDWAFGVIYTEWLRNYIQVVQREYFTHSQVTYNVVRTEVELGQIIPSQMAVVMVDKHVAIRSDVAIIDRATIIAALMQAGIWIKGYTCILPGSKACGICELKDRPLVSFKCDALDCKHKDRLVCSHCVLFDCENMIGCNDWSNKRVHIDCVYYPPDCTSGCEVAPFEGFVPDPVGRLHIYSGEHIRELIDHGGCQRHMILCMTCGSLWINPNQPNQSITCYTEYNQALDKVIHKMKDAINRQMDVPECISVLFEERNPVAGQFECIACEAEARISRAKSLFDQALEPSW